MSAGQRPGLAVYRDIQALKGRHIPASNIGPPLQGLRFCDDRNPGRRSRWSLALG